VKYVRKTEGYSWTDYKTDREITKELNTTLVLDKIQEYSIDCLRQINRMLRNKLPWIIKKMCTKRQKESGDTTEETSRLVRTERVNKWTKSVLAWR
jgi:acyl-ACP thioesterase